MCTIRGRRGFVLTELLTAVAVGTLVMLVCLFGISAAARAAETARIKSNADALAETAAEYMKNEIRFARDIDAVIESLSEYNGSLNDMPIESLTFEVSPDGSVTIRFTVAEFAYEYTAIPLNPDYH